MDEANLPRANPDNAEWYGTDLTRVRLERTRFAVRGESGFAAGGAPRREGAGAGTARRAWSLCAAPHETVTG